MESNKNVYIKDDYFDDDVISELYLSCQKHFDRNLLSKDYIEITNSIIDCHGLQLSGNSYFPYPENCWNILCLKIKKSVVEYCSSLGYDESTIVPFSCWAERNIPQKFENNSVDFLKQLSLIDTVNDLSEDNLFYDQPKIVKDADGQVKKHMIRAVYNLKTSIDGTGGTIIYFDKFKYTKINSKDNRLIVFDGGSYKSTNIYTINDSRSQFNIFFDWYINDPFDVPDWILP